MRLEENISIKEGLKLVREARKEIWDLKNKIESLNDQYLISGPTTILDEGVHFVDVTIDRIEKTIWKKHKELVK